MSFFEHIAELRKHILRAVSAIGIVGVVVFLNIESIFNTFILGPCRADFPTYRAMCGASHALGLGERMCFTPVPFDFVIIGIGDVIMRDIVVSFWLGFIGAFPFIFWEFWKFVSPGLLDAERKVARGVVGICSFLFILGVVFGFFVIAPFSINFLTGYTFERLGKASFSYDSYVTYLTMFTIPIGFIFEMPIVAYFLAKIGIIGAAFLRNYRRHALVVILIIAAIITPPDVVSQTLVTIPLYMLYELSIVVVTRVQRRRERALALEESQNRAVVEGN